MHIPNLQIINYGNWNNPNRYRKTKPRFVLTYELEYHRISYGETVINGHTYPITKGCITLSRPGELRYGNISVPETSTDFFYFVVKDDLQNGVFLRLLENLPNYFPPSPSIDLLWEALWQSYSSRTDAVSEIQADCHFLIFLTHLLKSTNNTPLPSQALPHQNALFEAIGYMREHLDQNVSVSDMAAHIGYSPSHFHFLFKSYTQHTPYAYFLSLKINQARFLLLNTDKTLTEISEELGFSKVSQFCNAFKKEFGITPAKFRKQRDVALYND